MLLQEGFFWRVGSLSEGILIWNIIHIPFSKDKIFTVKSAISSWLNSRRFGYHNFMNFGKTVSITKELDILRSLNT